jgi:LDH2 family malate/lactate/ureidoglycolate dehydrogenase
MPVSSVDSTIVSFDDLLAQVSRIFSAHLSPDDAHYVASCLVDADARGVASHGVGRIPVYTRRLREGLVNPCPQMRLTSSMGATARLDGDNAMGYLVARRAMAEAIERGREHGIGMVLAANSNHFGMAATYLQQALDAGLGALVLTNAPALMPVWGARAPFLGTSPFAFAAPGRVAPIMLDMATSVVAFGKIRRAARLGESIPADWALDAHGAPTTDPAAALDGVVLPMAGPKGSGLGLMMELMAGVMSGSAFGGQVRNQNSDFTQPQNVGHTFITFRPDAALPMDDYLQRADELVERARALPLADGFDSIHMPGERENAAAARARKHGLGLTAQDLRMLEEELTLADR